MAKKTLESNSKRKAGVEEVDLTRDEVLSSLTTKNSLQSRRKLTPPVQPKSLNRAKKPEDSNKNAKTSKKTKNSSQKLNDSKKKSKEVKKTDKKVKFESPVKRSGKKDEVEVKKVKKSKVNKEEVVDENENGALYVFPINRVTRIVKSENSDVKLSVEAAFLFNKASQLCRCFNSFPLMPLQPRTERNLRSLRQQRASNKQYKENISKAA